MAGQIYANISNCLYGTGPGTTIDEVQAITHSENYRQLFSKGDNDLYADGQTLIEGNINGTISTRNLSLADTLARGDQETLAWTTERFVQGAAMDFSCENTQFFDFPINVNHAEHDGLTLGWSAVSNDGVVNPISFAVT